MELSPYLQNVAIEILDDDVFLRDAEKSQRIGPITVVNAISHRLDVISVVRVTEWTVRSGGIRGLKGNRMEGRKGKEKVKSKSDDENEGKWGLLGGHAYMHSFKTMYELSSTP